jgi:2,3-bisphosphoglycerate-independent phosphoglycerate mutase
MARRPPLALIILDGWGINPDSAGNAIAQARKPNWDRFITRNPWVPIPTSGESVGLPPGQMGNSEVGHTNIGAGRIVYQDLVRINKAIHDGDFFTNPILVEACTLARKRGTRLHLIGLCSDGGVHAVQSHAIALLRLAKQYGVPTTYLHAITDGRDTPPRSATGYLTQLEKDLAELGHGQVATVSGRYYAMDRDNRWERVEKAYRAMVDGVSPHHARSATEAIQQAYAREESDEFILPTVIEPEGVIRPDDVVIVFNYRPDRAREITRTLIDRDFTAFERPHYREGLRVVCMTQYDASFGLPLAYTPQSLDRILSPVLADAGLRQLRTAETEKYAHVTFFFNGGVEKPFAGEERVLIPSPRVATYDLKPEMSAFEVADTAVAWINEGRSDVYIMNFANADMVGHTGDFQATVKAVEALDICLGRVIGAIEARGGQALITADHGNAEMMLDPDTGGIHTAHTLNPVPLIWVGGSQEIGLKSGLLSDIAPTMLDLLDLPKPVQMTGQSLLLRNSTGAKR